MRQYEMAVWDEYRYSWSVSTPLGQVAQHNFERVTKMVQSHLITANWMWEYKGKAYSGSMSRPQPG